MFYKILTEKVRIVRAEDDRQPEAQELVNGLSDVPHHRDPGDFSENVYQFHPDEKLKLLQEGLSKSYPLLVIHRVNRVPLLADP